MPLKSQGNILKSMIYLVYILIKDPNWHKLVLPANLEFIHKEWNREEKKTQVLTETVNLIWTEIHLLLSS